MDDVLSREVEAARSRFHTLHEIVRAAGGVLNRNIWGYLIGGTETETTVRRNRHAIETLAFRPRVLRDMRELSVGTEFLGRKMRVPLLFAPIGSLESFHAEGGISAHRGVDAMDAGLMLSSVSSISLEDVSAAGDALRVYTLYKRGDRDWMDAIVKRAIAAKFTAFCLTVDSAYYSRRERDYANRFAKPWRSGEGMDWQAALNWDDIKHFKDTHDIPLVLKGIATAEDAAIAVDHGVDVVHVSNHGGRQLDHGLGSFDVLPEIVQAVGGRARIVVDGGILRGTDIVKALALGADAVAAGRLMCCGLAAAGAAGVVRVLELLEEEMRLAMGLLAAKSVAELGPHHLRTAPAVRESHVFSGYPLLDYADQEPRL